MRRRAPCARLDWPFGTIPGASDMPLACSARWYTWLRPAEASRGVDDLGAISTSRSGLEIAPRSLTPSEAALGRSHVYQRAEHAKGISLAPGIVPKGQSRGARTVHGGAPSPNPPPGPGRSKADFGRLLARYHEAVSGKQSGLREWSHGPFRTHTCDDAYAWAGAMGTTVQHAKRCQT